MTETTSPVALLLPALRALVGAREVDLALRLLEAAGDVLEGSPGPMSADVLTEVADELAALMPGAALGCLSVAKGVFLGAGDEVGAARCDVLAGCTLLAMDELEGATEWLQEGLEAIDVGEHSALAGRGWHNLGIAQRRLGDAEASLRAQRQALRCYRRTRLAVETADCHVGIGIALHDAGRPEEALEPLAAARALYLEFGDQPAIADVDDRRGLVLCDLGRYEEAEAAHAAAATRYRRLEEPLLAARSERYRSHPLDHLARFGDALEALREARVAFQEATDPVGAALCDLSSAATLLRSGQAETARTLLLAVRPLLAEAEEAGALAWCDELLADPTSLMSHEHR